MTRDELKAMNFDELNKLAGDLSYHRNLAIAVLKEKDARRIADAFAALGEAKEAA